MPLRVALLPALVALVPTLAGCGPNDETSPAATSAGPSTTGSSGSSGGNGAGAAGGTGGSAGAPPVVLDDVISESDQSSSEHEPQIAVTTRGRVVSSWVDRNEDPTNFYHIAYRISDDRGVTWGPITSIPLSTDNNIASNVTLAVDKDGTVYLAFGSEYVDAGGQRSHQRVYLTKVAAADAAFDPPTEMTDPAEPVGVYDQPAITVTPGGALLLTYGEFAEDLGSGWLVMHFSNDGGATWTTSAPMKPSGSGAFYQNMAHACASPAGDRVWLYYMDMQLGVSLWRSDDGGKTWPEDHRIAVQAAGEKYAWPLDGNCVTDGDELWTVYGVTDQTAPPQTISRLTHVRLAHSSDGGATIDARYDVQDASAGEYYLLPRIASEGSGVIDVAYYAGSGKDDANASYRRARSTDAGKTFAPSSIVRTPITFELTRSSPKWFGDYMGLVWSAGALFGAYIDNSGPGAHVVFHREATGD